MKQMQETGHSGAALSVRRSSVPKKNQSLLWFPTPCLEISWTPLKHPTKKEQKVSVCGQNLIGDLFIQDKSREMITPETESVETKAQVVET